MFGLDGIFVKILKDGCLRVALLGLENALEMIREIKGFKILSCADVAGPQITVAATALEVAADETRSSRLQSAYVRLRRNRLT
jgi:hypothetical protein